MQMSGWSKLLLVTATTASTLAVSTKSAETRENRSYAYPSYGYHHHRQTDFATGTAIGADIDLIGSALLGEGYAYPGYYPSHTVSPYSLYTCAPLPPLRVHTHPVPLPTKLCGVDE